MASRRDADNAGHGGSRWWPHDPLFFRTSLHTLVLESGEVDPAHVCVAEKRSRILAYHPKQPEAPHEMHAQEGSTPAAPSLFLHLDDATVGGFVRSKLLGM